MTLKQRLNKLENKLGIKKMYVFEMRDGMDSGAIKDQFCKENGIDRNGGDLFIFIRRFCAKKPFWKFLYEHRI